VPVLAWLVLGERISANTLLGGAIIVVGVIVAVR
jgi:drug/metabolite transporter (DMT)-like permease